MRRLSVLGLVFIGIILTGINPALADLLFYDDCEGDPIGKTWKYAQRESAKPLWSIDRSNKVKRAGSYSYKFVLEAFNSNVTYNTAMGDMHCQLSLLARVTQGGGTPARNFSYDKEYWVGMSIYVQDDAVLPKENSGQWLDTVDFHGSADKDCDKARQAPLDMFIRDNEIVYRIKAQTAKCAGMQYDRNEHYYLPPFKLGAWNDVVMNIKFSYKQGGDGFVKVWINGHAYLSDKGMNAFNDSIPPYLKIGIYGQAPKRITLYYDEIRIGDEKSGYEEVAPKGENAPLQDPDTSSDDLLPPTLMINTK